MSCAMQIICKSFFKSKNEAERRIGLHNSWLQIISYAEQETKPHICDRINNVSQSFVSTNLETEEWNKR